MDQLDDLEKRVNELISQLSDIIKNLQSDIADAQKADFFKQLKKIENAIASMKREGIPVRPELTDLKIKLLSEHDLHQARIVLHHKIQEGIEWLLNLGKSPRRRTPILNPKTGGSPCRKPSIYEKPLGSKGNSNLEDYLIPVIQLMWSGLDHIAAFHEIKNKLDVRYNTVNAQCTKALGLTTNEFIRQVNAKTIVSLLEKKYPDQYQKIKAELKV